MKTIKIIDLYNLIANKEFDKLPKKVKYRSVIFVLEKEDGFINYKPKEGDWLLNQFLWKLNDEAEILEEAKKIPEKLNIEQNSIGNHYIKNEFGTQCNLTKHSKIIADKINEILNYLESKDE